MGGCQRLVNTVPSPIAIAGGIAASSPTPSSRMLGPSTSSPTPTKPMISATNGNSAGRSLKIN